jgi:phage baseplate assembly protein W
MMQRPVRAGWRFVHPDFDQPAGLAPGLALTPKRGVAMVTGDAAVRQAVLLLLSTRPGERVMRPDYGCDLTPLVFAPNDDTTAGLAMHFVRRAIERWEPRVRIVRLDAAPDPVERDGGQSEPGRLRIDLEYRVRATGHQERLVLPLTLADGER